MLGTILLPLVLLSNPGFQSGQSLPSAPRIAEVSLRRAARKIVMPEYPKESIKHNSKGVAVAQLLYDETGVVIDVEILEAPDDSIKESVIKAVRQWKFEPARAKSRQGPLVKIQGKLTFYFEIDERGKATVENPKQFKSPQRSTRT